MAADVLGQGLGAEVDPVRQRLEQQARPVGVVDEGQDAAAARGRGDGRDVLHLEGQGAGALEHDHSRRRRDRGHDLLGRAAGRDIAGRDPETLQHAVAEPPHRGVDAVDDEDLVAFLQHCQHGSGQGVQAAGEQLGVDPALQFGQGAGQGRVRGQAVAAIGSLLAVVQRRRAGHQHGRPALHRRPHRARQRLGRLAGVDQAGGFAARLGHVAILRPRPGGLYPVTIGESARPPHSVQEPS